MIIWRGWGIYVPLIWIGWLAATQFATDAVMNQKGYYAANAWPIILGSLMAGATTWFLGRALNDPERSRVYGASHSLFGVPMEYWGPVALVVGIAVAIPKM